MIMRKLISICLLLLVSSLIHDLQATTVYNLISKIVTEKESALPPQWVVTSTDSSYQVTFSMEEVTLTNDDLYYGKKFISISGFGQTSEPRTPSFPIKSESFQIPNGKYAVITIEQSDSVEMSCALAPARPMLFDNGSGLYTTSNVPSISYYTGYSKNQTVHITNYYKYRGQSIATIELCPIKYSIDTNKVKIYKKIVFNITFKDLPEFDYVNNIQFTNFTLDPFWNHCNLLNSGKFFGSDNQYLPSTYTRDFLIITVPEFESAAQTFIDWKQQEGYKCTIISMDAWTSELVKSEVRDFASGHPFFVAFMILGDVDKIPACKFESSAEIKAGGGLPTYYSDIPYACLDGENDELPDVLYGRIPAQDNSEAEDIIAKIIKYESLSLMQSTGFRPPVLKGLHVAQFQPKSKGSSTEGRDFVKTSETILAAISQESYDISRIYSAPQECNPMYYRDGTAMPSSITSSNFSWTSNPSDITSLFFTTGYVFYRGHGEWDRWDNKILTINDFSLLDNKRWQPLVFSLTCLTGRMDYDSFAKCLIRKDNSGASGVLAASNASLSTLNDIISEGIFQSLFPQCSLIDNSTTSKWATVGDALQQGLQYMRSQNQSEYYNWYQTLLYHWFGDPTMRMYTQIPQRITNIGVSFNKTTTTINVPDADVQITALYDNGDVISHRKQSVTFSSSGCKGIAITGINKIPQYIAIDSSDDNTKYMTTSALKSAFIQNGLLTVNYTISQHDLPPYASIVNASGSIIINSLSGQAMGSYSCPYLKSQIQVDASSWPSGIYTVTLTFYGKTIGSTTIVKK